MKHLKVNPTTNLVIVPKVRFSWMRVFKPELNQDSGELEYSVTLLFPKENCPESPNAAEILAEFKDYLKSVAVEKFGAKLPPNFKPGLRDGDVEQNSDGEPRNPGCYYISTKSKYKPQMVNGARMEVKDTDGWKSGDWGSVQLSVFAYDNKSKGISAGLRAIQFIEHGEAFGGSSAADVNDFATHEVKPYDAFAESEYEGLPNNGKDPNDPFA